MWGLQALTELSRRWGQCRVFFPAGPMHGEELFLLRLLVPLVDATKVVAELRGRPGIEHISVLPQRDFGRPPPAGFGASSGVRTRAQLKPATSRPGRRTRCETDAGENPARLLS